MTNTINKQRLLKHLDRRIRKTLEARGEDHAHYNYYSGVYAALALLSDLIEEGQFHSSPRYIAPVVLGMCKILSTF